MNLEAAVIGAPIGHTRSPDIFEFLSRRMAVPGFRYRAREVPPSALSAFVAEARGMLGFNITRPHKQAILPFLDKISAEAESVGAVNVVKVTNARLEGHNTDIYGVSQTLEEQRCAVSGKDAYLWGAGGAARAVAYALGRLGTRRIYLQNRDQSRAQGLAERMDATFPNTRIFVNQEPDTPLILAVNATPVGQSASDDPGVFSQLATLPMHPGALAFDLIYDSESTPFLRAAKARDLRRVSGLDMLIHQALATWEIWLGTSATHLKAELASHLLAMLARERPIFLTGLMGVGKSTVGSALARHIGWNFADVDQMIENEAGMTIARIFEDEGESGFRALENHAVAKAIRMPRTVVALGGGALMDPANLERVEQAGHLVFLNARLSTLRDRLNGSTCVRPLLRGLSASDRDARLSELLEIRRPIYERARYKLETDGVSPEDLAKEIALRIFGKENG